MLGDEHATTNRFMLGDEHATTNRVKLGDELVALRIFPCNK